jgi:hypothetical protein
MELMTEPGPRMRDTLKNSTTPPPFDHDRMWVGVQARHSTMSRRRTLFRWTMLGIAGAISATGLLVVGRTVPNFVERPVIIAADSVQEEPPGTSHMPAIQETPSAIIPLLGHRTQLRMDIDQLSHRRTSLLRDIADADVTTALRAALRQELAEVEEQLAASKATLVMVDRQLSGQSGSAAAVAISVPEPVTTTTQIVEVPTFVSGASIIPWFAGGGTLIMLMMIATMLWVRPTTRAALNEVASLRTQAGTQLTALSEGIEAIAVEVERIGESQRYISKAIATPNQNVAAKP